MIEYICEACTGFPCILRVEDSAHTPENCAYDFYRTAAWKLKNDQTNILHEPNVIMSTDLVSGQKFVMDAGVGIGILYEVLGD